MAAISLRPPPSLHLRSPQKDVFRPRFPIDPFASAKVREPWFVKPDQLPTQVRRDVVLVLGASTTQELSPLLLSKSLANALLIVASHKPPQIPHSTLPTVRVLRLKERLDIQDAGAVRLVNVLEWAERVGRVWRKHGGLGSVELPENDDGQEHITPPSIFRFSGSQSTPVSPRSSSSRLTPDLATLSEETSSSSPGRRRSALLTNLNRSRRSLLPTVDPTQRPFDAIVNFLPQNTSDKALLKQAILVTTISRPFLMAASNGSGNGTSSRSPSSKRRSSLFGSKSSTSVYLPPTPPYSSSGESLNALLPPPLAKAHLLHLLPRESRAFNATARGNLVQGLESFLISYAYPASLDISAARMKDDAMERARPYVMPVSQISLTINASVTPSNSPYEPEIGSFTLVDLALYGSLDGFECPSANSSSKQPVSPFARLTPRAWVSGPNDIVLLGESVRGAAAQTVVHAPNMTLTPPSPDALTPSSSSSSSMPVPTSFTPPSSPPSRPPRSSYRPRPPISQAAADSSFSSTLSSSSSTATSTSTSPVPTSPLAHEYDTKRLTSINVTHPLPTPPDSDESGSDLANPHSTHTRGHVDVKSGAGVGVLGFGWTPSRRRRAVSASEDGSDQRSFKTKSLGRRERWKFWRTAS